MIIELITPLILATSPLTITQSEQVFYSHETQQEILKVTFVKVTEDQAEATTIISQFSPLPTLSGTRTFDYSGQPRDSDND